MYGNALVPLWLVFDLNVPPKDRAETLNGLRLAHNRCLDELKLVPEAALLHDRLSGCLASTGPLIAGCTHDNCSEACFLGRRAEVTQHPLRLMATQLSILGEHRAIVLPVPLAAAAVGELSELRVEPAMAWLARRFRSAETIAGSFFACGVISPILFDDLDGGETWRLGAHLVVSKPQGHDDHLISRLVSALPTDGRAYITKALEFQNWECLHAVPIGIKQGMSAGPSEGEPLRGSVAAEYSMWLDDHSMASRLVQYGDPEPFLAKYRWQWEESLRARQLVS